MKAFRDRFGGFGCNGLLQTRTSLLFCAIFIINIYSLNGASDSKTIDSSVDVQHTNDVLKPTEELGELNKNKTDSAITINIHFGNSKPSEEEILRIFLETREKIRVELNRRRKKVNITTTTVPVTLHSDDPTTITARPVTTVKDAPVTTVKDAPVTTVKDAPGTTVKDAPVTTVKDAPVTTVTDKPTTEITTGSVTTPADNDGITQPGEVAPQRRKKRHADDSESAAAPAAGAETFGRRMKREDPSEDDYLEDDLPFVNISEWFKDGVLRVPIFIKNDKGPDSNSGDWNSVGDRLFKAATDVREELANVSSVDLSLVEITRGLPAEDPEAKPVAHAYFPFWLPILIALIFLLCIVFFIFALVYRRRHWSPREKVPRATDDGQRVEGPTRISPLEASNGHNQTSIPRLQSPRHIDDDCGWLVPMDHLTHETV